MHLLFQGPAWFWKLDQDIGGAKTMEGSNKNWSIRKIELDRTNTMHKNFKFNDQVDVKVLTVFMKLKKYARDSPWYLITSVCFQGYFLEIFVWIPLPIFHEPCSSSLIVPTYQRVCSAHRSAMCCKPIECTNWTPFLVHKLYESHLFVNIILVLTSLWGRIVEVSTRTSIYTCI